MKECESALDYRLKKKIIKEKKNIFIKGDNKKLKYNEKRKQFTLDKTVY
jgi:hypothetical protein